MNQKETKKLIAFKAKGKDVQFYSNGTKKIKALPKYDLGVQYAQIPPPGAQGDVYQGTLRGVEQGASSIYGNLLGGIGGGLAGYNRSAIQMQQQNAANRAGIDTQKSINGQNARFGAISNNNQSRPIQTQFGTRMKHGTKGTKAVKPIEVERDETIFRQDPITKQYKLVADFQGGKTHEQGGEPFVAMDGDVIFPGKLRHHIAQTVDKDGIVRDVETFEKIRSSLPSDKEATQKDNKALLKRMPELEEEQFGTGSNAIAAKRKENRQEIQALRKAQRSANQQAREQRRANRPDYDFEDFPKNDFGRYKAGTDPTSGIGYNNGITNKRQAAGGSSDTYYPPVPRRDENSYNGRVEDPNFKGHYPNFKPANYAGEFYHQWNFQSNVTKKDPKYPNRLYFNLSDEPERVHNAQEEMSEQPAAAFKEHPNFDLSFRDNPHAGRSGVSYDGGRLRANMISDSEKDDYRYTGEQSTNRSNPYPYRIIYPRLDSGRVTRDHPMYSSGVRSVIPKYGGGVNGVKKPLIFNTAFGKEERENAFIDGTYGERFENTPSAPGYQGDPDYTNRIGVALENPDDLTRDASISDRNSLRYGGNNSPDINNPYAYNNNYAGISKPSTKSAVKPSAPASPSSFSGVGNTAPTSGYNLYQGMGQQTGQFPTPPAPTSTAGQYSTSPEYQGGNMPDERQYQTPPVKLEKYTDDDSEQKKPNKFLNTMKDAFGSANRNDALGSDMFATILNQTPRQNQYASTVYRNEYREGTKRLQLPKYKPGTNELDVSPQDNKVIINNSGGSSKGSGETKGGRRVYKTEIPGTPGTPPIKGSFKQDAPNPNMKIKDPTDEEMYSWMVGYLNQGKDFKTLGLPADPKYQRALAKIKQNYPHHFEGDKRLTPEQVVAKKQGKSLEGTPGTPARVLIEEEYFGDENKGEDLKAKEGPIRAGDDVYGDKPITNNYGDTITNKIAEQAPRQTQFQRQAQNAYGGNATIGNITVNGGASSAEVDAKRDLDRTRRFGGLNRLNDLGLNTSAWRPSSADGTINMGSRFGTSTQDGTTTTQGGIATPDPTRPPVDPATGKPSGGIPSGIPQGLPGVTQPGTNITPIDRRGQDVFLPDQTGSDPGRPQQQLDTLAPRREEYTPPTPDIKLPNAPDYRFKQDLDPISPRPVGDLTFPKPPGFSFDPPNMGEAPPPTPDNQVTPPPGIKPPDPTKPKPDTAKTPKEESFNYDMPKMKRPLVMPDAAVTPEADPLRQIKLQENNYVDFSDPQRQQSSLAARLAGGGASGNAGMAMGMMAQAGRVDQLSNINNQEAQRSQQVSDSNVGIRNQQAQMNFNAVQQNDQNNAANRAAAQDINRENLANFRERRDNAFQNERTDLKDQMLFNEDRRQYNERMKFAQNQQAENSRQYDLQHQLAQNQQAEHSKYLQQLADNDRYRTDIMARTNPYAQQYYGNPGQYVGMGQQGGFTNGTPNPSGQGQAGQRWNSVTNRWEYRLGTRKINLEKAKFGSKSYSC